MSVLLSSVAASPALAEQHEVSTASVIWQFVDDVTGTINDAAAHDTPGNVGGWTSDAFDGFGQLRVTEPGSGQFWDFTADRRSSTVVDGERAEWVLTGSPGWAGFDYDITLNLTMQGNSVRWAYSMTGGPVAPVAAEPGVTEPGVTEPGVTEPAPLAVPGVDIGLTFSFGGELGSDDATQYTATGTTLMSDDGGFGDETAADPVLGYAVTTDGDFSGWTAVPGIDTPRADVTGARTFSVDVVYADYNSCGFAEAQNLVASLLPTLPAAFGAVHRTTGECLAFEPVTLELGVPVDQVLDFAVDPRLARDDFFLAPIDVVIGDVPAGLQTAAEQNPADGAIVIHLTGTPTELGDFTAATMFSVPHSSSNARAAAPPPAATPVYSSIAFRIVPAQVVVVPPVPTTEPTAEPTPDPTPDPTPTAPPVVSLDPTVNPVNPTADPTLTTTVTTTATIATTLPRPVVPAAAAPTSAARALPTAGIDLGRSLGFGLLAILAGTLLLTALALRSYARVARDERAHSVT